jgi:hypothetical protein
MQDTALTPSLNPISIPQVVVNNLYAAGVGAILGKATGMDCKKSALAGALVYDAYVAYENKGILEFYWAAFAGRK